MTVIEVLLVGITLALAIWLIQMKHRIHLLEEQAASRPPEPDALTAKDLQKLQNSMADLVTEIEQYTESQLRRMKMQTSEVQTLIQRLESKLAEIEQPAPIPVERSNTTRVVPLSPRQNVHSNHKDRDRIIDLYKKGWEADAIARELRITRGEVQLVVNLA